MKTVYISLLLLISLVSCTSPNEETSSVDHLRGQRETANFNTLVKGTGSPIIIFESGLGTPLNNWDEIQTALAAKYRTISYDRKGLGASPATDEPRTLDNLVSDLESLITQNEIDGPIVLVGHSLGGHIVRKYQQSFPSRIAGLFLVDPTNEYLYEKVFDQMTPEAADSMKTAWDNSYSRGSTGVYNEWKEAYNIDEMMRNCPFPADIPITILASYQESAFLTESNAQLKREQLAAWQRDKPNVNIVETTNSGHYIHLGEPAWVIAKLTAFLVSLE